MAVPGPSPADTTTDAARWLAELHAHPTHHDLLAAFDLLQTIDRLSQGPYHLSESTDDQPPREPIRFTHSTDLALPLGELLAVTHDPDDPTRHILTTAGTGPCGPASPLPLALADELADDPLTHAVLDLFHHRRTLLLCRGLLAADLAGSLDTHTAADPWSRRIIALVGLTHATLTDAALNHSPLIHAALNHSALTHAALTPPEALRLAPLLASADRSPRALALALRRLLPALCPDHGDAQTLRCELIGDAWTPLAAEHHTRLGGPAARLGDTAALGTALRLPSAAARLHLGPLPATAVAALRPGTPLHARLCALLAIFIPEPITLDLVIELEDLSFPPCLLGQQTLGRDLFLTPDPAARRPHRLTIPLTA